MKKILISLIALAFSLTSVYAQQTKKSIITDFGIFDSFTTTGDYISKPPSSRGLYWRANANGLQKVTRDSVNKRLTIEMSQIAYGYDPFSLNFGKDLSGNPYTVDLSYNGKFSFDITNPSQTIGISVRVNCQDINDHQIDCDSGVTGFNTVPSHQTQIEIPAGQTVRFEAGKPNGVGNINTCNFTTGVWGYYNGDPKFVGDHVVRYDCDLRYIKAINLTVMNADKSLPNSHAAALPQTTLYISNFLVGDTSSKGRTAPKPFITLADTVVYLHKHYNDTAKIKINTIGGGIWYVKNSSLVTVNLDSTKKTISVISVMANNTSSVRSDTIYLTAKYTNTRKIIIKQEAGIILGAAIEDTEKKDYYITGTTINLVNKEASVYNLYGQCVSSIGNTSVTLPAGFYIIVTHQGSEKVVITEP